MEQLLNINEIASDKIVQMHESGQIKERIEKGIEGTINNAIDNAVKDYSFQSEIQNAVKRELGDVAAKMDFSAYKNYLITRVNKFITESVKNETADKIEAWFKEIYLSPNKVTKLSQVIGKYKEFLMRYDETQRSQWENFNIDIKHSEYGWIDFRLSLPDHSLSTDDEFIFTVHKSHQDIKKGYISTITFNGRKIDKQINFTLLSDFEILIFNILYNKTELEIDVESEDDFDTYLYDND